MSRLMPHLRRVRDQLKAIQPTIDAALRRTLEDPDNPAAREATLDLVNIQLVLMRTLSTLPERGGLEPEVAEASEAKRDIPEQLLKHFTRHEDTGVLVNWPMHAWQCPVCGGVDNFVLADRVTTREARPDPESPDFIRGELVCQCSDCGYEGTVLQAALAHHRDRLGLEPEPDIDRARREA